MVEERDLFLGVTDVDVLLGEVLPEPAAIDILVEDVGTDPLVVEADVSGLGTRRLPGVEQAKLDIVGILADLARP